MRPSESPSVRQLLATRPRAARGSQRLAAVVLGTLATIALVPAPAIASGPAAAAFAPLPISLMWARALAAAQGTQEPQDGSATADAAAKERHALEQLAARVRAAHGAPPEGGVKAFRATIRMDPLRQQEDQVSAVLDVKFLGPGLIRYKFESERNIERGIGMTGSWTKIGEEVEHHGGRTSGDDAQQVQQHLRLAKLYLRFLDPAAIVRGLKQPSAVREGPLKIGRALELRTRIVEGDVDAFPIWARAGASGAAHLTLYVDMATDRLVAVRAVPIGGTEPQPGQVVAIAPDKWQQRQGNELLLPSELVLYTLPKPSRDHGKEQLVPEAKIALTNLDLAPKLGKSDFDPKR